MIFTKNGNGNVDEMSFVWPFSYSWRSLTKHENLFNKTYANTLRHSVMVSDVFIAKKKLIRVKEDHKLITIFKWISDTISLETDLCLHENIHFPFLFVLFKFQHLFACLYYAVWFIVFYIVSQGIIRSVIFLLSFHILIHY